ncbi:MAG: hypothetical protein KY456_14055 [Chloroflexi bacterium]|nr:hypothetical protein [Chloroflexota bacterium]
MTTTPPQNISERAESINWPLWFGVLGGPIAWSLHLVISYLLVRPVCWDGGILALHLISLGLVLTALAAAAVSWRQWRSARDSADADMHGTGSRVGFMAVFGILSGVLFAVATVVAWVPIFLIGPCVE